jgi:hypothetical protein
MDGISVEETRTELSLAKKMLSYAETQLQHLTLIKNESCVLRKSTIEGIKFFYTLDENFLGRLIDNRRHWRDGISVSDFNGLLELQQKIIKAHATCLDLMDKIKPIGTPEEDKIWKMQGAMCFI